MASQLEIDRAVREFVVAGADIPCLAGDSELPDRYDGQHSTARMISDRQLGHSSLTGDVWWDDHVLDYSVQFWARRGGVASEQVECYNRAARFRSFAEGSSWKSGVFEYVSCGPLLRLTDYVPGPEWRAELVLSISVRRERRSSAPDLDAVGPVLVGVAPLESTVV